MNVAVIGASNKPDRYSYKAVNLLKEKGHIPLPVHVRLKEIDGVAVYSSIDEISERIDTVSMYVSKDVSDRMIDSILAQNPKRIIFNPGAENPALFDKAQKEGIIAINACTLVMLRTGQF